MRAFAEIDLDALRANVALLRERAGGAKLLAVVKADGYGHGLITVARAALEAGANWLGVALLEEALSIRSAGISARTIAWLTPVGTDFDEALRHDIDIAVPSVEILAEVIRSGNKVGVVPRIHVEIDTGLHRGGVISHGGGEISAEFKKLIGEIKSASDAGFVELVGAWSHFARADEVSDRASEVTLEQVARYREALDFILMSGMQVGIEHLANSAGVLGSEISQARFTMVRAGIALYGLSPSADEMGSSKDLGLRPVMTLKAKLHVVKSVKAGASVGYGGIGKVVEDTQLGVVALGYADGIPRSADSTVGVTYEGKRAAIVGRVSMDQFVVDLGADSTAKPGDLVIVFSNGDNNSYTADEWAKACGSINYEIVTRIGPRVPRIPISHE